MEYTIETSKTHTAKALTYKSLTGFCLLISGNLVKLLLVLTGLLISTSLNAQLEDWDSDQDAMPNGWEFHRGLNVNDAKDAWADPDGDGIANLYEYYLGSDPQDKHQPEFIHLQAGQNLAEAIQNAERGTVLKIPQGTYLLNYQAQQSASPPRLMLQGGWNEDFTEQDHCRYPTVLDGGRQGAIFNLLIASGNSAALILDGFTIRGGSSGAIRYTGYLAKAQLLLANCHLTGNRAHRASAILDFTDGESASLISDLILVNSLITGNKGTGIRTEQYATRSNLKLLHSIVALNEPSDNDSQPFTSGYGIEVIPEADSTFYLQIVNSILWGNANAELQLTKLEQPSLEAQITHNLLGFLPEDIRASLFSHPSNRSIDPLFKQTDEPSVVFEENSPVFQAGEDIGFFPVAKPDIGARICEDPLPTAQTFPLPKNAGWQVYPNPAREMVYLRGYLQQAGPLTTDLYNTSGRKIATIDHGEQAAGAITLTLPVQSLAKGRYLLTLTSGHQSDTVSFVK